MTALAEAAQRRAAGVRAPADRPSQRRVSSDGPANVALSPDARISLRAAGGLMNADGEAVAGGDTLHFTGYATVYETAYEMWDAFGPYTEVVSAGAGAASLATPGLSVPLVLDHDPMRRIASTDNGSLTLLEDATGLLCDAPALDCCDMDVAYIAPKMRSVDGRAPLISEMSFRFHITSGIWSPDYTEYRIQSYDIHRGDVSIVGYGANPTTTSTMRGADVKRSTPGADLIFAHDTAHRRL